MGKDGVPMEQTGSWDGGVAVPWGSPLPTWGHGALAGLRLARRGSAGLRCGRWRHFSRHS